MKKPRTTPHSPRVVPLTAEQLQEIVGGTGQVGITPKPGGPPG